MHSTVLTCTNLSQIKDQWVRLTYSPQQLFCLCTLSATGRTRGMHLSDFCQHRESNPLLSPPQISDCLSGFTVSHIKPLKLLTRARRTLNFGGQWWSQYQYIGWYTQNIKDFSQFYRKLHCERTDYKSPKASFSASSSIIRKFSYRQTTYKPKTIYLW